jgi:hypothetical protein
MILSNQVNVYAICIRALFSTIHIMLFFDLICEIMVKIGMKIKMGLNRLLTGLNGFLTGLNGFLRWTGLNSCWKRNRIE